MLGELYVPTGKALETAQQVMEIEKPYACNVAMGCSNQCLYCYGDTNENTSRRWGNEKGVRYPKQDPCILVGKQLMGIAKPSGVFLSFMTDPFMFEIEKNTKNLISWLVALGSKVATLSKMGTYIPGGGLMWGQVRTGMTIVSIDEAFARVFEPNAPSPQERIKMLKKVKDAGDYVWVSLEPYPTPTIWKQSLICLLKEISFVDFIIFGKWNYDARVSGTFARDFYRDVVDDFQDYCKEHNIRHFVKSETMRFIRGAK